MHPAMQELSQLPVSERLELVQELWDSIEKDRAQLPVQDWQREIVNARLAELNSGVPGLELTIEELWRKVDEPGAP
jgi:putative addiction module component (TIGR02574 family)